MRGEPEKQQGLDAEYLAGMRFPYQEDMSLIEDVDLLAATPGEDINWLEDIHLLVEEGVPAVFDRYSNSFLRIYFPIPDGREDEIARKVLIKHLQTSDVDADRSAGPRVGPVAEAADPSVLGGQQHVGLAHADPPPRLVGLRLEPPGALPVDRQLGQDLERRALARRRADLLQVEPPRIEELVGDPVPRLPGAPLHRLLVLIFAELVQHLPFFSLSP